MLQRLVANWLKEQARDVITQTLDPQETQDTDGPPERELVVIFPNRAEAGGFVDKLAAAKATKCNGFVEHLGRLGEVTTSVIEAPLSHERLAQVTLQAIKLRQPRWVLSSGFVVALHPDLRKGHLLMTRRVIDEQDYSLSTGLEVDANALAPGVHAGTLMTLGAFPATAAAKDELSKSHDALSCDRQAAIVAEVCRQQGTRMMAIHVVAESLAEQSRVSVREVKAQDSLAARIGAAAGAMIEQPSSAMHYWNEKETTLRLSDRLASFLTGIVQQLT